MFLVKPGLMQETIRATTRCLAPACRKSLSLLGWYHGAAEQSLCYLRCSCDDHGVDNTCRVTKTKKKTLNFNFKLWDNVTGTVTLLEQNSSRMVVNFVLLFHLGVHVRRLYPLVRH